MPPVVTTKEEEVEEVASFSSVVADPPPPPYPGPEHVLVPPSEAPAVALHVGLLGLPSTGLSSMIERFERGTFPAASAPDVPGSSYMPSFSAAFGNEPEPASAALAAAAADGDGDYDGAEAHCPRSVEADGVMYQVALEHVSTLGPMQRESADSAEFVHVDVPSATTSLDCAVVGYAVDSAEGFAHAEVLLDELSGRGLPCVLAATKSDLDVDDYCDSSVQSEAPAPADARGGTVSVANRRAVTVEAGAELALIYGIPFVETSALTDSNIDDLFANLVVPRAAAAATCRLQRTVAQAPTADTRRRFPRSPYEPVGTDPDDADDGDGLVDCDHRSGEILNDAAAAEPAPTRTPALTIESATRPTLWWRDAARGGGEEARAGIGHLEADARAFLAEIEANASTLEPADPKQVGAETAAALAGSVMAELDRTTFSNAELTFLQPKALRQTVAQAASTAGLVPPSIAAVKDRLVASLAVPHSGNATTDIDAEDDHTVITIHADNGAKDNDDASINVVHQVWLASCTVLNERMEALASLMETSHAAIPTNGAAVADATDVVDGAGEEIVTVVGVDELVAPECEVIAKYAAAYLVVDEELSSTAKLLEIADAKAAISEMKALAEEGATRQNKMAARKMSNSVKLALEAALKVNTAQLASASSNQARAEASMAALQIEIDAAAARVAAAARRVAANVARADADRQHVAASLAIIEAEHVKSRAALFAAEETFRMHDKASEEMLLGLSVGGSGGLAGVKAVFAKAMARAVRQANEVNVLTKKQAVHDTRSASINAHATKAAAFCADIDAYAAQCKQTESVLQHLSETWQAVADVLLNGYTDRIAAYRARSAELKSERYELATLWVPNFIQEFTVPARKKLVQLELEHSKQTILLERFVDFTDPEGQDDDTVYARQEEALAAKANDIEVTKARLERLHAIRVRFLAGVGYAELAAELDKEDVTAAADQAGDAAVQRMRRVLGPNWATVPVALAGNA